MSDIYWLWILTAASLLLDLLISAAKSSFAYVRLPVLLQLKENNTPQASRAIDLLEKPGLRIALRLASTLTQVLFAGSLTLLFTKSAQIQSIWLVLLGLVIALLVMSILEFWIERAVLTDPEKSAMRWTGLASACLVFYTPAVWLMTAVLGGQASRVTLAVTEEALRNWVELEQGSGTLEKEEREMIFSIFRFGNILAREIMVPRMDLLALDVNTTISEARQEFIQAGHSRVPVYEDTIDNVIGLLYAKDLLSVVDGSDTIASQRRLLRPAYFVPEAKKVDELLTEMQSRGIHMALVVDEYGGVAGVVTLEDIVEEIVGEIRDEYDQGEEQLYQLVEPGVYIFLGRTTIEEFNEITGCQLVDEVADTLGGFIYSELGHVPLPGEAVRNDCAEFSVEEVLARRILKIRVHLASHQSEHTSGELNHAD